MLEVYFLILLILFIDGFILYCKYTFDKPHKFDIELSPILTVSSDYLDMLALPFIFVFPFGWLIALTQSNSSLRILPFVITILLSIVAVLYVVKRLFKRYYFTDEKIIILNLVTKTYTSIPISAVNGYSYRRGYKGSKFYFISSSLKNINISYSRVKNHTLFHDYFKKRNIQYYEYDWLTGNDYKTDGS